MTLFDPPPFRNLIPYGQKIHLNQFPEKNRRFDCPCQRQKAQLNPAQPSSTQLNPAQTAAAPGPSPWQSEHCASRRFEFFHSTGLTSRSLSSRSLIRPRIWGKQGPLQEKAGGFAAVPIRGVLHQSSTNRTDYLLITVSGLSTPSFP